MEQLKLTDTIEFKANNGTTFTIRAQATRGDQYEMHASMSEGAEFVDGRIINTTPGKLYPWLIKRFVVGWSGGKENNGQAILDALFSQPAEADEDLILVLGAHILVSVKGLSNQSAESKKKG